MELSTIVFYLFAAVTVGSAAAVVFVSRLIYAVFALLFTFFGVAGLYVFLNADFLAGAQVLIYVGGILILLLFGVMLTNRIYDLNLAGRTGAVSAQRGCRRRWIRTSGHGDREDCLAAVRRSVAGFQHSGNREGPHDDLRPAVRGGRHAAAGGPARRIDAGRKREGAGGG